MAGNRAMALGQFEPEETAIVREILKESELFINVGANVGYYCCHALSLDKPVIAVEPLARNLHYLLKNIKYNGGEEKVEVFPVALGAQTNIFPMWGGNTGASLIKGWASIPESYVTQVPCLTLDRVVGEKNFGKRIFVLADIEGAELMMLEGARSLLNAIPSPIWMVEISSIEHQPKGVKFNPNWKQTFEIFFRNGYRAYTADAARLELSEREISNMFRLSRQSPVHNYIFEKRGTSGDA